MRPLGHDFQQPWVGIGRERRRVNLLLLKRLGVHQNCDSVRDVHNSAGLVLQVDDIELVIGAEAEGELAACRGEERSGESAVSLLLLLLRRRLHLNNNNRECIHSNACSYTYKH